MSVVKNPQPFAPILRGKVSISELDLMLFVAAEEKSRFELAVFMQLENISIFTNRLEKRNYLKKERVAGTLFFSLTDEGKALLAAMKARLETGV